MVKNRLGKPGQFWFDLFLFVLCSGAPVLQAEPAKDLVSSKEPVERAVKYLSHEVNEWKKHHDCYACHHHGDGAKALFDAKRQKVPVAEELLSSTVSFLVLPEQWDQNGPDGPFSDRKLARIQFASALAAAVEAGIVRDKKPLVTAAEQLVKEQDVSGAWKLEESNSIGGPTTYGETLATVQVRRVLKISDEVLHRLPLDRSLQWLRQIKPASVTDCAAQILGLQGVMDDEADAIRERCRKVLAQGQSHDGGWGPFVTSPPEAFDTALVILALRTEADEEAEKSITRARKFLVCTQQSDGSWPETTRPIPRESYSQRISTTAWATMALLPQ